MPKKKWVRALWMAVLAGALAVVASAQWASANTPYHASAHCSRGGGTGFITNVKVSTLNIRTCTAPTGGVHAVATGGPTGVYIYRNYTPGSYVCLTWDYPPYNYVCSSLWFNSANGWWSRSASDYGF
jgi:hypothetical protein